MDEYKVHRNYICIDLKSFYASVECLDRGLDIFSTSLVVTDTSRGDGSITLAMTPYMKEKYGIKARVRVFQIPKDKDIIFAKPRMNRYMEMSAKIVSIYLDFVSQDDMYVYSVDECFLDVTDYLAYYQCTDYELAKMIKEKVFEETGIHSSVGIGPNMLIAKFALDIGSKKYPNSIAKWSYDDLPTKLWPIRELRSVWGIGNKIAERLGYMGIKTVGDIAAYDVNLLIAEFGVIGEELYYHVHGIDQSDLRQKISAVQIREVPKSFGVGQTLHGDTYGHSAKFLLREMVDDQCQRLRTAKYVTSIVAVAVSFNKEYGGGFSRRRTIKATQNEDVIYQVILDLFNENYDNQPIRKMMISLGGLTSEFDIRYSLFDDIEKLEKHKQIMQTLDTLQSRFGKSSVMRAKSLSTGNKILLDKRVGGHNAE